MKRLLLLLLLLPLLAGCTIDLPGNEPIPVPAPVEPVNPVNKAPVALYSISHRIPYTEQDVVFDGTYSRDSDGWIEFWRWDLGPAGIQTGSAVTVVFHEAGSFPVKLAVTDNDGACSSIYRILVVEKSSGCNAGSSKP